MHMNIDGMLVAKIVNEVKSQGVFDQFRKDSMADVDTKPAYQNLRQRVETTVSKFLAEQTWKQDLNKNQLREKLRKHITEAGFLDTGVERIVDQVVNPKISTVFQPKIEDIAYKYLGVEKPQSLSYKENLSLNGMLEVRTDLLPTDLEAVSPDSEKATNKSDSKEDFFNDSEDKNEEFESPPFEPIEGATSSPMKKEDSNHSQLSAISGLTSQDSLSEGHNKSNSDKLTDPAQESELSQVSSNSRLSIVTNDEDIKPNIKDRNSVDISEEAQMPKFNESYHSSDNVQHLHFDIKKEEIKFEGTDWKAEKHLYESHQHIEQQSTLHTRIKLETDIVPKDEQNPQIDDICSNSASNKTSYTQESCERESDTSESCNSFLSKTFPGNEENSKNDSDKQSSPFSNSAKEEYRKKNSHTKSRGHANSNGKNDNLKMDTDVSSDRNDTKHYSNSSKNHSNSSSSRGDSDRRKSSSSKYKSSKDGQELSQTKNNEKRRKLEKDKEKKKDDHSAARHKERRRKSTDSNDGDSNKEICRSTSSTEKKNKAGNASGNVSSNNSNSSGVSCSDESRNKANGHNRAITKPTILDEFLLKSSNHNVEIITENDITINVNTGNDNSYRTVDSKIIVSNEESLKFFEMNLTELKQTEELLDKLNNLIKKNESQRHTIYLYDCEENIKKQFCNLSIDVIDFNDIGDENKKNSPGNTLSRDVNIIEKKSTYNIKNATITEDMITNENNEQNAVDNKNVTNHRMYTNERKRKGNDHYTVSYHMLTDRQSFKNNGELILNCLDYDNISSDYSKLNPCNKRYRTNDSDVTGISPSSELSVSSKENEFIDKSKKNLNKSKNIELNKAKVVTSSDRSNVAIKTNQRYSSEDLYKPRPILGQRPRRRALNADVI